MSDFLLGNFGLPAAGSGAGSAAAASDAVSGVGVIVMGRL